jgi:hypothetical protein
LAKQSIAKSTQNVAHLSYPLPFHIKQERSEECQEIVRFVLLCGPREIILPSLLAARGVRVGVAAGSIAERKDCKGGRRQRRSKRKFPSVPTKQSLWGNGYCDSFNSKLRDEFLNGAIFYSMKALRVRAERWRIHYNMVRQHSMLGYRSPRAGGLAHKQPGV